MSTSCSVIVARRCPLPPRASARKRIATVAFNTGQTIDVTDAVLIGRRPRPTDSLNGRPFTVTDESLTLSKTHARLYWEGEKFYAVDAGSANGIIVTIDGHQMIRLNPLVPFPIEDGMTLELGDVTATFAIAPEQPIEPRVQPQQRRQHSATGRRLVQ